ncbi:extracellular solute-binding protein family 1 [Candidatus Vecturithrix granuli]|uniref:Extracellular solute-binding protein family 1 n=1 Tax=Vecturithrix granuli TaxID=1499967 RepID=A0A081C5I2_VECG1|nr:extracellular solute-binding protein family 1 [Candidatus Vecturithrix granuli]
MKKILSIALSLFLLMSLFVVWAEAEKVRIVHIHWTQPPYDDIVNQTAKDFMEKYPDVEVKVLFYADADMPTKVRTVLAAGGECDTFAMPNMQSAWFMANDLAEEVMPSAFGKQTIEEVVDMWEKDAFIKVGGYYNGKYYGIPHEMSNYAAWINTAYMKEAGLDPEKDIPKTWEEFVEVCQKMTKRDGQVIVRNGFAINVKAAVFPFLILHTLMEQKGLDWSTEEGFLASLDTPEAVEALTTFTNWATKDGIFDPGLFENEREGFGNGLCATFLTGGTWYWGVLDQYSVKREDVTPMRYPRFKDGKDVGGVVYGYSMFVAKQAKNKEWAWKWLDFLESRPEAYIVHGYYQPRKSLDPALADQYIPNNDVFGAERSSGAAIIASANLSELQDAVGAAVSRVIFQGMSNEESLQLLKDDVEMILE